VREKNNDKAFACSFENAEHGSDSRLKILHLFQLSFFLPVIG
jgi:hypothetical protein